MTPPAPNPYVLSLDRAEAQLAHVVGKRISLLARARAAGLPVRRSRCVTRAAFEAMVAAAGDTHDRAQHAAQRSALLEDPLPAALCAALSRWSRSFTPLRVCGFAAQQRVKRESVVALVDGVCGPAALEGAVRQVWSELVELSPVAVLITDMAPSELRGRALSCVPGTAAGEAHLVEVEGEAPLVIDLDGLPRHHRSEVVGLTAAALEQVALLLGAVSELVGGPVEIEWALRHRRIWLTRLGPQLRGVHRIDHLGARAPGPELWSNFSLREDLRLPLTPLSLGLWRDLFLPVVFESLTGLPGRATRERRLLPVDLISGRLYWNANRMLATPVGALFLRAAPSLDRCAGAALQAVQRDALLQAPSLSSLRKLWALGRGLLGLAGVLRRAVGGLRIAVAVRDSRRFAAQQLRAAGAPLDQVADEELMARTVSVAAETRDALRRGLAHELLGVLGLHAVRALWPEAPLQGVGRHGARVAPGALTVELRRIAALLRRGSDLPLSEDPDALAELVAQQDDCRQAWQDLIERSGHRAPNELELAAPRWRDDPTALLRSLQAATAVEAQSLPEQSATARTLPWGLRWLPALVGSFMLLRDFPRWAFAAGLDHLRRLYLESGRRLVERGKLSTQDDVFMLESEEVRDLLLGLRQQQQLIRARISERQRVHARDLADRPPDALRSDGLLADPPGHLDLNSSSRSGLPAATGHACARVRVMDDASGREPPPRGEILVVTAITPGWAPMLCGAAALVTEAGDWASHAAAMAREAGLPAVLGVPDATRWLRDGDEVHVDGDRGLVELVSSRQ